MIKNITILGAVQELLGKDEITNADILSIKKLDLSGKQLSEVTDLSEFRNLENLILTENCISDLSPISELTALKELRAGNDPFLSDIEKAERKGKNHITDFTFLKNLKNLTHVCFTDTDIDTIEFVNMLPNLVEFWAYCNPDLKDISPLKHCKSLYKAYFYACPLADISVCRELPSLCGIAINDTGVSDISSLEGHDDFVYLDAHDAEIYDLSSIRNMTKMKYLTLARNHISDIAPLLGMQSLTWLTLGGNKELEFDNIFSVLPKLKGLDTVTLFESDLTENEKSMLMEQMPKVRIRFDQDGAL